MKRRLAAFMLFAVTIAVQAQWLDRQWPDIPRTADGRPDLSAPVPRGPDGRPDLTGVWNAPPPVARLDPSILEPSIAETARQRQEAYYKERPYFQCLPSGPETERAGGWKRFIQTSDLLAILNDDLTYRVIHMDGRELEAEPFLRSWMGYSVGHWDGDTLVVESSGFNDRTWVSRYGVSHTDALRVTELYRRRDFGHLDIEVTFTDPAAFSRPWGHAVNMVLAADTDMLEEVCEHGSENWEGRLSDASREAVTVPADVLARYVGVYTGIYGGGERTYQVSLSDGQLTAAIVGAYSAVGLGSAGLDEGASRQLVPRSQTQFEGLGLGYRFVVDDEGAATDLIVTHVSGNYRYSRRQ